MGTVTVLEQAEPKIEGEAEREYIHRVISIGKDFETERARIEASPYLNEAGKQSELGRLRQVTEARLGEYADVVAADIDTRIGNLLGEVDRLTRSEPAGDGVAAAHRAIRRSLEPLGLDALGREQAYLLATERRVEEAFESAPPVLVKTRDGYRWESFVREELVHSKRVGRAAAQAPHLVADLNVLETRKVTLKHFTGILRQAMRKVAPISNAEARLRDLDGNDVTPKRH